MKIHACPNGRFNVSGTVIKERRIQANLSQEALAAKLQLEGLNITQNLNQQGCWRYLFGYLSNE